MSFQHAPALFWLIPLGGAIIVLYLLKMRRRDVRVPASFLWPPRTDEVRANSLFQRLRLSWLLFLQLLALLLLVLALARPQTRQQGLAGAVTVLVLDSSASMGATDASPTRFDVAKALARGAIETAQAGDRLALIEAGPSPRVVFPLSNDPSRQIRALESLRRTDAETDVGAALRLAAALVGAQESGRIVLLSDGVFEPVRNFDAGKAALVYKSIGSLSDNMAVSALGVAETARGRQLYCGVKNYGRSRSEGVVGLYADGRLINSERIVVAPGAVWGSTIDAPPGANVFEARLQASDLLAADNYAVALADPGASISVLLVSRGNLFLERALALDPRVTLDRADAVPEEEKGEGSGGRYDVVVFDGIPEVPVRARGILSLGAAGEPSPVHLEGAMSTPGFLSMERAKLMEGVDLSGVYIERAQKVRPKPVGQVLAQSRNGPLIVAAQGSRRQIYVSFEPLQSDFPLQPSFPIFIANALGFLAGEGGSGVLAVRPGVPFSIPAVTDGVLQFPDGASASLRVSGGAIVVRQATTVGQYLVEAGGRRRTVYAAIRSDRESSIAPVERISVGGGDLRATPAPMRYADFWRPLALFALLVLAGEWWLYARRS